MKKILVPTDFSECAEHAVEVAASLAKKMDARLYIIHVMDIPVYDRNDSFQSYSNAAEGIFWMKLVKKRFGELFKNHFLKVLMLLRYCSLMEYMTQLQVRQKNIKSI